MRALAPVCNICFSVSAETCRRNRRHSSAPFHTVCTRSARIPSSRPASGEPARITASHPREMLAQHFAELLHQRAGGVTIFEAHAVWRIGGEEPRRLSTAGRASASRPRSKVDSSAEPGTRGVLARRRQHASIRIDAAQRERGLALARQRVALHAFPGRRDRGPPSRRIRSSAGARQARRSPRSSPLR